MFRDLFGLTVGNPEIMVFKSLMARFYRPTYGALLAKILASPVLHADETYVKLRTGTGYGGSSRAQRKWFSCTGQPEKLDSCKGCCETSRAVNFINLLEPEK
jgi:hypothetical protein